MQQIIGGNISETFADKLTRLGFACVLEDNRLVEDLAHEIIGSPHSELEMRVMADFTGNLMTQESCTDSHLVLLHIIAILKGAIN